MIGGMLLGISAEAAKLVLAYGVCAAIILAALILMGCMKRRTERQMRPASVKKACVKAKKFAEKSLQQHEKAKRLLGAPRLYRLSALVADAVWLAFQIAENKRDILFDGIANGLDGLATSLATESEQGYLSTEEYETSIQAAIERLDTTIAKLEKMIEA